MLVTLALTGAGKTHGLGAGGKETEWCSDTGSSSSTDRLNAGTPTTEKTI